MGLSCHGSPSHARPAPSLRPPAGGPYGWPWRLLNERGHSCRRPRRRPRPHRTRPRLARACQRPRPIAGQQPPRVDAARNGSDRQQRPYRPMEPRSWQGGCRSVAAHAKRCQRQRRGFRSRWPKRLFPLDAQRQQPSLAPVLRRWRGSPSNDAAVGRGHLPTFPAR